MSQLGANMNYSFEIPDDSLSPRTLLDIAARRGHFGLVRTILDYGASLTESTLIHAIKSKNVDLVLHLLHEGAEIDSCVWGSGRYLTPYSEAIRHANLDLVQLLQDGGALNHITEKRRFGAAVCAASHVGNIKTLQNLIEMGADGCEEELGYAFMEALTMGHEEVALLIIDFGADIHRILVVPRHEPVLQVALKRKMKSLVRALLNADVVIDYNYFGRSAPTLNTAIEWGDHSIIKDLIFAGAQINNKNDLSGYESPLSIAVRKNDMELIQLLLAKGADVNSPIARIKTPLAAAVSNDDINLIRFLLQENADPGDDIALLKAISKSSDIVHLLLAAFAERYPRGKRGFGSEALCEAIRKGNGPLFEALLNVNADISRICLRGHHTGRTPLALAIEKKNLAIIQRLLDRELDLDDIISVADQRGYTNMRPPRLTALLVAVCAEDLQIIQLLINRGANVNLPATRGVKHTPLQMAAKIGSVAVVQVLIRNVADVNAQPAYNGGGTALQYAAIGGFIGIAEELLNRGADVNAPPAKVHGRTALEGAIEHGRIDMVQFLLIAHAEFRGPGDRQHERAMKFARNNGHWALIEMLESYSQSDQKTQAGYIHAEYN